jgi:2'-5' RNA ligase
MPRLFIAIEVSAEVREAVARAQSELRSAINPRAVSWTRPDQFHLTLKFLGEVRQEDVTELEHALQTLCASFPPFSLHAAGVGFFPTPDRPRVLWAAINAGDGGGFLLNLHRAIETAAAPLATEKPENRFHAHITMGRARELFRCDMARVSRWGGDHAKTFFGEWCVEGIVLMQSRLSPEGAAHSVLARFPLGAAPG